MAKRQKTVFTNAELPHIWAHQAQKHGRTSNRNFYFDGPAIYSYGSHFMIACHITNDCGEAAVLLTTETYGHTTNGHISGVRRAVSHEKIMNVSLRNNIVSILSSGEICIAHSVICNDFRAQIQAIYDEAIKGAKFKAFDRLQRMKKIQKAALEYARFFGLEESFCLPISAKELKRLEIESNEAWHRHHKVMSASRAAKYEKQRQAAAEREAFWALSQAEQIEKWRAGEAVQPCWNWPTILRLKDNFVQTSKGAQVPVSHARRAIALVNSVVSSQREFNAIEKGVAFELGVYKLDKVTIDGTVYAGCHIIPLTETKYIADLLLQQDRKDAAEELEFLKDPTINSIYLDAPQEGL